MKAKGSSFYATPEGKINAAIIAKNSARLNDELIQKYGRYDTGLIMGYGDGEMVEYFKDKFSRLIIVEGSKALAKAMAKRYQNAPSISCYHSYFESFNLPKNQEVDVVLGNHVIEHVDDPVEVLKQSKTWLGKTGLAIFSVPNASSLHRRIGVEMKLLPSIYDLNDRDRLVGHQRVYDIPSLRRDLELARYTIVEIGGFNLKLVSQKQMMDWPQELFQAIFEVSRHCPAQICSNLYAVVR